MRIFYKAFNGGYGLVLDGSKRVDEVIRSALDWDVMCGVARRGWARNENAVAVSVEWNKKNQGKGQITLPYQAENGLVKDLVEKAFKK